MREPVQGYCGYRRRTSVAMRAIVAGDLTAAEAERRHGVSASAAVAKQSDRLIESGKARLESGLPGRPVRAGR